MAEEKQVPKTTVEAGGGQSGGASIIFEDIEGGVRVKVEVQGDKEGNYNNAALLACTIHLLIIEENEALISLVEETMNRIFDNGEKDIIFTGSTFGGRRDN
jgi:hypothetical protein